MQRGVQGSLASNCAEGPALCAGNFVGHRFWAPQFGAQGGDAEPSGGQKGVGGVIGHCDPALERRAAERGQRGIEIGAGAHLGFLGGPARCYRGERGVDFDDCRAGFRQRIDRPDRQGTAKNERRKLIGFVKPRRPTITFDGRK